MTQSSDVHALLATAAPLLDACAAAFSDRFFDEGRSHPDLAALIGSMTEADAEHLRTSHAAHLRFLTSDVSDAVIAARARRSGRVHAELGIGAPIYARALAQYRKAVVATLADWSTESDRIAVWGLVNQRVLVELEAHLEGHSETTARAGAVAVEIGKATTRAATVADLARGVLREMATLPGVTIGCFGRPNDDGEFQFEVAVGERVTEFLAASSEDGNVGSGAGESWASEGPRGSSPPARAWRTGEIVRSDNYRDDVTTAAWHEMSERFGFRSSVAIPLTDDTGAPRALLAFYSRWPAFFAEQQRSGILVHTRVLMQTALMRLEAGPQLTSGFSDIADRAAHVEILARGGVVMHYQPIVDLATSALIKLEALARLDRGGRLISPAEFLPSFGRRELWRLFEIGLDQALTALNTWERTGLTTSVSLNLPSTFALAYRHSNAVAEALDRHRIAPHRLTLEVLETGAIEQGSAAYAQVLDRIRALGVRIAEDDLGTAYSSLLRLRSLTFDEVKIAQELVRYSPGQPREQWGFIQPLTDLVHQIGPTVTIEGLETPGLIEAAAFLGADHGQGYGIARPMPAGDVPTWAAAYRLSIDKARPATTLGALAAHLAWELRLSRVAGHPQLAGHLSDMPCPLTAFLARYDGAASSHPRPSGADAYSPAAAREAHRALHAIALSAPNGHAHRDAWARMARVLGDAAA